MRLIHQFQRYYHTVKYLKTKQIIARLFSFLRRPFFRKLFRLVNWFYEKKISKVEANSIRFLRGVDECVKEWMNGRTKERAKSALENRFNFLNIEIQFNSKIDWQASQASKLWRYNLHYFDYAPDLGLFYIDTGNDKAYEKFKSLVLDWIEKNQIGQSEGWEAYPVSCRIVNWILAFHLFAEKIKTNSLFYERLLKSLFKHALFLERSIEYEILGNHLIKNGKALVFVGLFFTGEKANQWYKKGISLLRKELHEQILPDGGHFECSPMYHLIVLQDYLEVLLLLRENEQDIPSDFEDKINSQLDFLSKILHPDGEIPLLNDSGFGITPHPLNLLAIGNELLGQFDKDSGHTSYALDSSGYYVMRDKAHEKYLVVDCGKICPDYLPPHAHADTLSYELSIGNERLIVDSGVYKYASSRWRDFFRSTRAHNTVVVDGLNQSDVWGSFRVGHRAFPTDLRWIVKDDITFFEGGHDGYLKQLDILHKRRIFFIDNNFWLIFDELDGKGKHLVEEYIHFHPDLGLLIDDCRLSIEDMIGRQVLQVIPFAEPEVKIVKGEEEPIQGWYSHEFGKKEPNSVLLLRYEASLPLCVGYGLFPNPVDDFDIEYSFGAQEGQIELRLNNIKYTVELVNDDNVILQKGSKI